MATRLKAKQTKGLKIGRDLLERKGSTGVRGDGGVKMTKIYESVKLSKNNNTFKKNPNSVEGIPSNSEDSGWVLLGCSPTVDEFKKLKVTFMPLSLPVVSCKARAVLPRWKFMPVLYKEHLPLASVQNPSPQRSV